jgi:hypothetical protein
MKFILICFYFIAIAISQFTLSNTANSLSDNHTLVPNVQYQVNFTLSKIITAGSSIMLTFASPYRIPSASLSNCMMSTSSSVAASAANCSSVYSSGLDVYSIVYSNAYPTGGSQSFLSL